MNAAPAGLGSGWICQLVPFQPSASDAPTAVHAVRVGHDTALKKAKFTPGGLGVGWTSHLTPFHRSAKLEITGALGSAT